MRSGLFVESPASSAFFLARAIRVPQSRFRRIAPDADASRAQFVQVAAFRKAANAVLPDDADASASAGCVHQGVDHLRGRARRCSDEAHSTVDDVVGVPGDPIDKEAEIFAIVGDDEGLADAIACLHIPRVSIDGVVQFAVEFDVGLSVCGLFPPRPEQPSDVIVDRHVPAVFARRAGKGFQMRDRHLPRCHTTLKKKTGAPVRDVCYATLSPRLDRP